MRIRKPDFYPRSPCGERRQAKQTCRAKISISIHALLAESDVDKIPYQRQIHQFLSTLSLRRATLIISPHSAPNSDFYPRSPCGERHILCVVSVQIGGFLSTLSLRRATSPASVTPAARRNFYPRSPCGERPTRYRISAR